MIYEVTNEALIEVDFAPKSEEAEIMQNVRAILSTEKYSIPLARNIGLGEYIDRPINQAKAKIAMEVIEQIKRYERRAEVEKVESEIEASGRMKIKVQIKVKGAD